jgi:hypothetical protein
MVDETVSLRIAAMFVLFFASFAGITIPLYGIKTNLNTTLPILNAASAGVMMGLALVRLSNHDSLIMLNLAFTDTFDARGR